MTPLRQRMIEDMCIRNFAGTTQRSYIHYVAEFAKYFHRSPARPPKGQSPAASEARLRHLVAGHKPRK